MAVATIQEWWDLVGVLRPLEFGVVYAPGHTQGVARCWGLERATITLYRGSFEAEHFERIVRHTMLHELAHIHMLCSDVDHSDDPADLMYPHWNLENLDALPNRDAIRERWYR